MKKAIVPARAIALVAIFVLLWTQPARAGCRVSVQGRNGSPSKIIDMRWLTGGQASAVRNRIGVWRRLPAPSGGGVSAQSGNLSALPPGGSFSVVFELDFGCNVDRRWRFHIARNEGGYRWSSYVAYYPSQSDFTHEVVISLGDVNRFFPN